MLENGYDTEECLAPLAELLETNSAGYEMPEESTESAKRPTESMEKMGKLPKPGTNPAQEGGV